MSKLDLTDPAALDAEAVRVKRMLEHEFGLPLYTCDRVNNDTLRLLVWRDKKEDPGPLTGVQRQLYSQQYFSEIFHRKRNNGELIFRSAKEARELLLDHSFKHLGGGRFERGDLTARIFKVNLIFRVMLQNEKTKEVIDNERKL